jgi:hypothetical protein
MRVLLATFVLVCGLAGRAEAVSLRDLIDLSKQGISDDILIALVEAEKSVFHLGAADVRSLKGQGLSDRLVIYLLQTPSLRPAPEVTLHVVGQRPVERPVYREPAPLQREEPAPQVVIIEHVETVAVPVYVPVHVRRDRRDADEDRRSTSPTYWGHGGKLRPDAWGQAKEEKEPEKPKVRKDK